MIDPIMNILSAVIIVLSSIVLYVFLISSFLPYIALRWSLAHKRELKDRGVRKVLFAGGRSIIYEPELSIRKYVKQYVLVEKKGAKFIKCKINEGIRDIRYEVAVFNAANKMIDVVGVSETIAERGYTRAVALPPETSYVMFFLKEARGQVIKYVDKSKLVVYNTASYLSYLIATVITTVLESLLLKYMIDLIFETSEANLPVSDFGIAGLVLSAAVVGAVYAALVIMFYKTKLSKVNAK